jgi:quercetin dioxygenase-like cupin family protein
MEGQGVLVNKEGQKQPLKAGDFALVMPDKKHQYRNKGDHSLILICGVRRSLNKFSKALIFSLRLTY